MGGLCAGAIPSVPEVEIDMEALATSIQEAIESIPEKVQENIRDFPGEITKADPQPFCVPDTNLELTKDSTDAEIASAALIAAFATTARDALKDAIWSQIEPKVDEQLAEVEVPDKLKNKAKDIAKEKTVDAAVDKALDEALEKMKTEGGGDNAAAN